MDGGLSLAARIEVWDGRRSVGVIMSKTPHTQATTSTPDAADVRKDALDAALQLHLSAVDDVISAAAKIEAYLRDGTLPATSTPKT